MSARCAQHRSRGFTYLMVLLWVAISGVMLMALSRAWLLESRRERDTELAYRGEQIRLALSAYAAVPVSTGVSRAPARLEDLLEDRRSGQVVRHLRRVWRDPITNSPNWGLLKDANGGIVGVYSLSKRLPLLAPQGVKRYEEWRFEASAGEAPSSPAAASAPGAAPSAAPGAAAPTPPATTVGATALW